MQSTCFEYAARFLVLMVLQTGFFHSVISQAAEATPNIPLKVLTLNFNSEEVINDSDFFVRDRRYGGIKKWVQQNDPDILFLQEAWTYHADHSVAQTLARDIGYDLSYRLEMGFFNMFCEADAVLTKKTLKMSQNYQIKLPHSADEVGNGRTWVIELGAVAYAVGATVQTADGSTFYVYSTHLTASTPAERGDQAAAVIEDAKARALKNGTTWDQAHVIVAGDFNSVPGEPSYLAMTSAGFVDTFDAVHPGDPSCSQCELPTSAWFNPFTIAPGQLPSQASDNAYARIDYVFSHGPGLNPVTSTLTFTAPYNGVWMSDHYGVSTVFGNSSSASVQNPVHDSDGSIPPSAVEVITSDLLVCQADMSCEGSLPTLLAQGARGVAIENRSNGSIFVTVQGPGLVLSDNAVNLATDEQSSFTFMAAGDYTYTVTQVTKSRLPSSTKLTGTIHVEATGY